ncbi:MAG: calcium/sodium antiporter [Planctomycetota bacterium]
MFWTSCQLLAALILLALGAEGLVRGSVGVARRCGISSFFIGLTIVGFGTSTPELFTSIVASLRGQTDIAVGNVVGSNIFNTALILGLTALVCPIPVRLAVVRREVLVVIAASVLPYLALSSGGVLGRPQGALFLGLLGIYLIRGYRAGRREGALEAALEQELEAELRLPVVKRPPGLVVNVVWIILGLAVLILGSRLLVHSSSALARSLGVSDLVIGLTIVAAGTSAPELFTSIVAAARKQSDIAVGNILGSNIFNLLGILGTSALVTGQRISGQLLWLDLPLMILLAVVLLPIVLTGALISRFEGAVLALVYLAYLFTLYFLA